MTREYDFDKIKSGGSRWRSYLKTKGKSMKKKLAIGGVLAGIAVILAAVYSFKFYSVLSFVDEPVAMFYEEGAHWAIFGGFLVLFLLGDLLFCLSFEWMRNMFDWPRQGWRFYLSASGYFWLCCGFSYTILGVIWL